MSLTTARIDAHLHVWDRRASEYAWLAGALDRDFLPADAHAALRSAGVDRAILVQAEDSEADTRYLLATAEANPWVEGVVAWVPLADPAAARPLIDEWASLPIIRGVRALIHTDPDARLADPAVAQTLRAVAVAGLALDVPDAWPRHLGAVAGVAAANPGLTIVIDHLGKPPLGTADLERWERELRDAAAHPNTFAKVSGLQGLTPAFTAESVRPAWEIALDAFGPERLLYGGDWPMTVPSGGYPAAWAVAEELIAELSAAEQAAVLSGTARRVYGREL